MIVIVIYTITSLHTGKYTQLLHLRHISILQCFYCIICSVELVPLSKDSVVCLPRKLAQQLGGINPICLVHRITNSVHLIDFLSGQSKLYDNDINLDDNLIDVTVVYFI